MELLFDKEGADPSDELKSLLGFVDADIDFSKIKPDATTATNDLVQLIGQTMYDTVLDAYKDDDADEASEYLVYVTRYPVAVDAYRLFAPDMDLSHTNNGRKMRQDDNEKLPFEWMIEKNNEALERRYYRALDDMLRHYETLDAWKATEAYKKLHRLFITTTDQFDEHFRIGSRLVLLKLEPGIRQCEQREIKSRIGKTKFDALKAALTSGEELLETDKELLELIREACVFYAMAWAMLRLTVTIFPEGVLQAYTSDRDTVKIKRPAAKLETQAARQAFLEDAAAAFLKIEQHVAPVAVIVPGTMQDAQPKIITGEKFISL